MSDVIELVAMKLDSTEILCPLGIAVPVQFIWHGETLKEPATLRRSEGRTK